MVQRLLHHREAGRGVVVVDAPAAVPGDPQLARVIALVRRGVRLLRHDARREPRRHADGAVHRRRVDGGGLEVLELEEEREGLDLTGLRRRDGHLGLERRGPELTAAAGHRGARRVRVGDHRHHHLAGRDARRVRGVRRRRRIGRGGDVRRGRGRRVVFVLATRSHQQRGHPQRAHSARPPGKHHPHRPLAAPRKTLDGPLGLVYQPGLARGSPSCARQCDLRAPGALLPRSPAAV